MKIHRSVAYVESKDSVIIAAGRNRALMRRVGKSGKARILRRRISADALRRAHRSGVTVGAFLRYLSPELLKNGEALLTWPPDVFGVAATILQKCGAYIHLVSDWPPKKYRARPKQWVRDIERLGKQWRRRCLTDQRPPQQVERWWKSVLKNRRVSLGDLHQKSAVCEALLNLCAVADEASMGAGIPNERQKDDPFQKAVRLHLALQPGIGGNTLCKVVHKSKLRVLPKLHTPQSGMTIRSLSHHLALCPSGDVDTYWHWLPRRPGALSLNLLLVPWPTAITPSQFRMLRDVKLRNMPNEYGFFSYDQDSHPAKLGQRVLELMDRARLLVRHIDGVIFPELAISQDAYESIKKATIQRNAFLICGIGVSPSAERAGQNYLALDVPYPREFYHMSYTQPKHHRWLLDVRQIVQYGLGGSLDPGRSWWEYVRLERRKLTFFAMRPWLTLCALICEDLARQDPVAEIVRAVGPNLVVALLMDGPQLASRWSARYATVLADDPGSSVLTLTSIGMAQLSRPPHGQCGSRIVGLWKDVKTGDPVPIELPAGAEAIVLSLTVQYREEWTADGRSDHGQTGYPVFGGLHPVFMGGQYSNIYTLSYPG